MLCYPVPSPRWFPPGVLDTLDRESAKQLILEISNLPDPFLNDNKYYDPEAMAFGYLLDHFDGYPFGLELLGHRLSHEGSFLKARERYERQHTQFLRIGTKKKGSPPDASSSSDRRHFSLATCLDVSYDTLSDDARRLFHLLSESPTVSDKIRPLNYWMISMDGM